MTLLVFGRTGQVATELARLAPAATFLGREEADLARPQDIPGIVRAHAPEAVINAAAYTAVDRAEEDERTAARVNGASPGMMAEACRELGIPLVHISTDYVFDGQGDMPFKPDDPTAPLGGYGRSKAAGEAGVRRLGGSYAILRTSWVFSAHGANFVKTMLRLSETRERLTVVADQVGGPTPGAAIAAALIEIAGQLVADPAKSGTYHFSGAPDVSWAGFAREIMAQAGRSTEVADIPTSDYPTPAKRPANSRLDCTSLKETFGIDRPDWRAHLTDVLKELGALA
jgi:dTDP-4-dehydrorhamnose reductase